MSSNELRREGKRNNRCCSECEGLEGNREQGITHIFL